MKLNEMYYAMISCHFPENVNNKLSTSFIVTCHFSKFQSWITILRHCYCTRVQDDIIVSFRIVYLRHKSKELVYVLSTVTRKFSSDFGLILMHSFRLLKFGWEDTFLKVHKTFKCPNRVYKYLCTYVHTKVHIMYILNLIANRVTQHDNIVIGLLTYMDSFTCMYTIILRSKFSIEFDLQV